MKYYPKDVFEINKRDFDEIIRINLASRIGADKFVYKTLDDKRYDNYYENNVFENFVEEMRKYKSGVYFNQYDNGNGGELKEKKGRYGFVPPKMASVASSSRFCYLALKDGGKAIGADGDVNFEVGCKIDGVDGNSPQLDACFSENNIYVETKCHEIFDSHKPIFRDAYWHLIYGENNQFGFDSMEKNCKEEFEIPLTAFGIEKVSSMFDIKQLVCHLMGIASGKNTEDQATLQYLFFKPKTDDGEITEKICKIFDELKKEINLIFNCKPIKNFTEKNNIKLLAVAEYAEVMQALTNENVIDLLK